MKYIRFVVGHDADDIDTLTGIITETQILQDEREISQEDSKTIDGIFEWFNKNLPCPPWSQNNWDYGVSWYKFTAHDFINKMWELANILKDHGKSVRMLRTTNPGKIVYDDESQVVAIAWCDVQ